MVKTPAMLNTMKFISINFSDIPFKDPPGHILYGHPLITYTQLLRTSAQYAHPFHTADTQLLLSNTCLLPMPAHCGYPSITDARLLKTTSQYAHPPNTDTRLLRSSSYYEQPLKTDVRLLWTAAYYVQFCRIRSLSLFNFTLGRI